MNHFLENTPVFNGSVIKKKFAVEMIDIEDGSRAFVVVHADSEEDAITDGFWWQKPTGVVFEVLDV